MGGIACFCLNNSTGNVMDAHPPMGNFLDMPFRRNQDKTSVMGNLHKKAGNRYIYLFGQM
jgi:hypothetical protein